MSIQSMRKFEITPSNKSSADAVFSYKSGTPVIDFTIPSGEMYLNTSDLRFNCKVRVLRANSGIAQNPITAPNNTLQNAAGGGGTTTNPYYVRVDPKVANVAAISQINIANNRNQTLELVKDVPRLYASLLGNMYGWGEFSTYLQMMFGSSASTTRQGNLASQTEVQISMPILAGMFLSGTKIPLGSNGNGVSGLKLSFTLNPSIAALFGGNAGDNNGSWVELRECSLSGSFGIPAGNVLPPIDGFGYTAFSSFYNVLNNNDETQSINTALKSVISVFSNLVPTESLSNWSRNGQLTLPPYNGNVAGEVTNYAILKNGQKYPLRFRVDETENRENNQEIFASERQRYFMSAIKPYNLITSTLAGPMSEGQPEQVNDQHFNDPEPQIITAGANLGTDGGTIYGLGVRMDQLGVSDGADFSNSVFSHRIQSTLDSTTPNSIYTYFLHKNVVSFPSPGMISVVS